MGRAPALDAGRRYRYQRGMTRAPRLPLLVLAALLAVPGGVFGAGFKSLAKDLARGAERGGVKKLAVLPFIFVNRPVSAGPVVVSERITTELTKRGGVLLVERSLLAKIMSEQRLSLTGALDAANSRKLGAILNVDAVVCGTIVALGEDRLELNARIIKADTGEIIGAAKTEVKEDWNDGPAKGGPIAADSETIRSLNLATVSLPEALYRSRCASCHGADGEGGRRPRSVLDASTDLTRPSVQRKPDEVLGEKIGHGGEGMPAHAEPGSFPAALSERQIGMLVGLVRRLGREGEIRKRQRTAGGKLFDQHCAVCHGYDGKGSHLAAGLFESSLESLDLTNPAVAALDDRALGGLLAKKKRKMVFRADLSQQTLTEVWLYLQALSKR